MPRVREAHPAGRTIHIRRWGHSLGMVLPKDIASELHVDEGTVAHIAVEDGRLIVTPQVAARKEQRLRRPLSFYYDRAQREGRGQPVVDEILPDDGARGGELA